MEIVIQIAGKIVDYTFAPVGQWLCYSFHYDSNMENLKNQEERLRNFKNKVQHSVDAASRNGEEIEGHVETWLRNATTKLNEIEAKAGNRSSNAACLNLKHRHQLSREAKKMVENIDQLLDEYHKNGNFEKVSYRPPPEGMETTRTMDYMAMESRMTAVKDIMEALGNADIDKIGVWGMPGVGKSTLMKEIARQAMEEKLLFNEVVMAVVTVSPDVKRIQGRIAFTLGLNFDQQTDEEGRASQLKQRLSSKDKKILVILDDIWKELDLQEIGIPSKGCKVVMTSRDHDVLVSNMGAQKDIELKILQEAEAWDLFEKMAGDSFKDQPEVRRTATDITKKCAGLPLALVTVSKALKNKSLSEWKDALRRLERPAPEHITGMLKEIYNPIEVSYNNLESQELKSLFLLCAQLPYFLSYHALLIYSYGCDLFHDINTLEDARDTLDTLLRKLKDSSLLLENSYGFFILHDLVRDVATIIASKDRNMFVMRYDDGRKEWPDVDALKRCQAFSISYGYFDEMKWQILNTLFQGMEKLKVLDLKNMRLPSLPSSLLGLRNLQTLCLDYCELEDISGIGELKNLVVLRLLHSKISTLPREIGSLVRLQMLDLSNCSKLEMIPPNIISCWGKLEELYMGNSIVQWEVEGLNEERKNASLAELKHLSNLNTLEIQIPDVSKLPKDLNFEKLERYKICIGDVWHWSDSVQSSRTLKLKLNSSIQSEFWNKMPLKRMEILHLNGVMSVNLSTSVIVFPTLETFILSNMIKLEEICQGELPSTSFKKLRVLKLENCEKLRFVFSSSIARGLSLLEKLKIKRCNNMGAIVVKEEKDGIEDGDVILFPRLQTLVLENLPELASFLSTRSSFTTDGRQIIAEGNRDLHMPLLHHQVSFPSLQTLRMWGLPKIKYVWSCGQEPKTVCRCIEQLKILEIMDCGVEEIVAGRGGGGGEPVTRTILEFPRVTDLRLMNLKRLKWFYKGVHVTKWPMLERLQIQVCDKVEIFASGVVSFEETVEERQSEMSIKQPLFLVDEVSFPSLQTLSMWGLPKIKYVWSYGQEPKTVCRCLEQLKILEIMDCGVEEIVAGGGGGGGEPVTRTILEFPRVTDLRLIYLKRLKWFYKGVHVTKWPMLEKISISGCEKVEIFASGVVSFEETVEERQSEMSIKQPLFLVDEGELHSTSFQKLRVLKLENCEKFRFVFSSSIAKGLSLLEILEIKRCNNMGAIVVKEEKDGIEDGDVILFQQLQTLVLEGLPELVSFLSTRSSFMTDCRQIIAEGIRDLHMPLLHHQVSFPSLQTLRMRGLPKIKYVWSYGQEPKTVCRCLEQLKILEIEDCEVLEEIVAGGGGGGGEPVAKTILEFPRVTDLRLTNLKRLKWFYKRVHISKWPMLKEMWIEGCEKVKIFASGVVSFEETVKERSSEMSIKQPLFLVDELSFSSLKKLHIKDMYKLEIIWQDQVAASSFSKNIQDVEIVECEKLLHVFQSNFRTTTILTQRLTRLCIWDCLSLETIFRNMEGHNGKAPQVLIALSSGTEESIAREDGTARHIEFPILTQMILGELPKLKWILEGVHTNLECPSLESLELWECDQVLWASKFASNSSSQETSQQKQLQTCIQLPLPNLLELQVWYSGREEIFPYELVDPVPRLRRLELRSLHMLTHLWKEDSTQPCPLFHNLEFLTLSGCDKLKNIVPSSVFLQNLTELDISDCDGLINLLTSSTAKTLVQLKEMTLMKCKRITEIVAMEDGEANVAITFNKLAYLKLAGLPKLTHFCSGSYSFGFPSLKEVSVRRCPEMKPFWDGVSSTTPELRVVYLT